MVRSWHPLSALPVNRTHAVRTILGSEAPIIGRLPLPRN
jgi:hypothetical protein